jgi:hypothetical protein
VIGPRARKKNRDPLTNAELVAWNLGRELAANPHMGLQGPDEPWRPELIAMSDERLEAMRRIGPESFFSWVDRGWWSAGGPAAAQ